MSQARSHHANHTLLGIIQVILAGICWGALGIFSTRLQAYGFSSFEIATLRIVTAGLVVLLLLPSLMPSICRLRTAEWLILVLQSLVGVLGMTLCYFYAISQVGVSMAVALLYTAPVFSLILARLLLSEPISARSALLAVVAVIGVGALMAGDTFSLNTGIIVGLASGLCYSLYGILGKLAMNYQHSSQLVFFSSVAFSSAALLLLPQTYATYASLTSLPLSALLLAIGISIVGTIAPFFLYMSALEKLPASQASVFTIVEPLTAIILAIVLLHQPLLPLQFVGVALIVGATLFNALGAKKKTANAS